MKEKDLFTIRCATQEDISMILDFIKELAKYEGMIDQVTANKELLRKTLFVEKRAEVIFCEYESKPVGFALFFHNYSTFLGKPGIYLEDLFVYPDMRGKGAGKKLLTFLAKLAIERDCGRLEWWCLDWNKPSIDFYLKIGAKPMSDWTVFRVDNENLLNLAQLF
jgi:GNAT superfamily N-acetyltransferase